VPSIREACEQTNGKKVPTLVLLTKVGKPEGSGSAIQCDSTKIRREFWKK
jgi:hypothetical protein